MKKIVTILLILIAIGISNAYVAVDQPQKIEIQEGISKFVVNINTNESNLDFSIIIPLGASLQEWKVNGVDSEYYNFSSKQIEYLGVESIAYFWSFKNIEVSDITIEATISTNEDITINTVWVYPPNKFDTSKTEIVKPITPAEKKGNFWIYLIPLIIILILVTFWFLKKRALPSESPRYEVEYPQQPGFSQNFGRGNI